jgi:hypothetical protein
LELVYLWLVLVLVGGIIRCEMRSGMKHVFFELCSRLLNGGLS